MLLSGSNILSLSRSDERLIWILRGIAFVAGAIVLLILTFIAIEAFPAFQTPGWLPFFTDPSWSPTEGFFNLVPMIWGSFFATFGAILISAPLGIASAVFCQFYAPRRISWFYRRMIELLAGIPSVVYGVWGLIVLVPWIGWIHPPGPSLLAGVLVLAIMVLPILAMSADASLSAVPTHYLQSASALGLSRWTIISKVIFPAVKSRLFSGLILQTGRAIGETMAILMVCGNVVQTPKSVFEPIRTLTSNIALETAYAMGSHRSALFMSGMLLMVLIVVLVILSDYVDRKR